jgi:ABC-type polysaccharide/polyol phosphate transport system ATPase subunit
MIGSSSMIDCQNISKGYYTGQRSAGTVKAWLSSIFKPRTKPALFYALRNVSFQVSKGEIFGILGQNGSGKSTALYILGGIVTPTAGKVSVNGTIGCLLTTGVGFSAELTGAENAMVNSQLLGLMHSQAKSRIDPIFEFAEISSAYRSTPLKRYSSGMIARLAFSVAIECIEQQNMAVMLLDEVLSVGDIGFQEKCNQRMMKLVKSGTTVVVVSQSPDLIADLCNRAMWLEEGQIQAIGDAATIGKQYQDFVLGGED